MVASATIGSAVVGAGASIFGGSEAAGAQSDAAAAANNAQLQMFGITQKNLQPYMETGQHALTKADNLAGTFNFTPTQAQLEQTPGYQFNLYQGQKGVANSAAARGLANSGAALKGAANYATGLADSTYQNQFNNALQGYQTNFNSLNSLAGLGESAAAGVGNAATQTGASIGSNLIGAGNAQAAAWMNAANGVGNAGAGVTNGLLTNRLLDMYGQGNR